MREESLPAATRPIPTDVRIVAADSVSRAALRNAISSRFAVRAGTFEPDQSLGESAWPAWRVAVLMIALAIGAVSARGVLRHRSADLVRAVD